MFYQVQPLVVKVAMKAKQSVPFYDALLVRCSIVMVHAQALHKAFFKVNYNAKLIIKSVQSILFILIVITEANRT